MTTPRAVLSGAAAPARRLQVRRADEFILAERHCKAPSSPGHERNRRRIALPNSCCARHDPD